MKNKKLLSLLSIAAVLPLLGGCNNNDVVEMDPIDPKEVIVTPADTLPVVRFGEDGEELKINDPDDPANSKLTSLEVTNKSVSLFFNKTKNEFDTAQINLNVRPYNASVAGVTYTSADPAIASVDGTGKITAVGEGVTDITVKSPDGTLTSKCHVVVNNSRIATSAAGNRKNEIVAKQNEATFDAGESIYVKELYNSARYEGEGTSKRLTASNFSQEIWASEKYNYFRIVSNDTDIKVEGGSQVPSRVDYIFYTTEDYYTYIFKTDGNKRNYMRVDQSSMASKGFSRFDALSEVIGNFFVAGAAIITNQFKQSLGADITSVSSYWTNITKAGRFDNDHSQLAIVTSSSQRYIVGDDQEDDFDIPARTYFTVDETISCLWENNLVTSKIDNQTWSWEIDETSYREDTVVEYYFEHENIELLYPDMSLYTKVDDIFGL